MAKDHGQSSSKCSHQWPVAARSVELDVFPPAQYLEQVGSSGGATQDGGERLGQT